MGRSAALVYSPHYLHYRFSPDHPLDPIRLRLTFTLISWCGLLDERSFPVVEPRPASDEELELVHSRDYIRRVKELGAQGAAAWPDVAHGLGIPDNPIFPGMHEATALVVGGSLVAAEEVMAGRRDHAFNFAGGLHHAMPSRASGFCIYNDPAIVIASLLRRGVRRVMYVDTDAHHGDGVQEVFYRTDRVLTISFHETGEYLFPGTGSTDEIGEGEGQGYSVNVPLRPYTGDESYLECFHSLVPELARIYRPEVIVAQNGCDGHVLDPLTHLRLTTRTFEEVAATVHRLAHELCDGRLVALGGGGYSIWNVVPRAWTLVWARLTDQTVPDRVPDGWRQEWAAQSPSPLPERMRDTPDDFPETRETPSTREANRRTVQEVKAKVLPLIGGDRG